MSLNNWCLNVPHGTRSPAILVSPVPSIYTIYVYTAGKSYVYCIPFSVQQHKLASVGISVDVHQCICLKLWMWPCYCSGGSGTKWICSLAPQHNAIHRFKNSNVLLINAWGLHLWPLWNYSEVIFTSLSLYIFWPDIGKAVTNLIVMDANRSNASPYFPAAHARMSL